MKLPENMKIELTLSNFYKGRTRQKTYQSHLNKFYSVNTNTERNLYSIGFLDLLLENMGDELQMLFLYPAFEDEIGAVLAGSEFYGRAYLHKKKRSRSALTIENREQIYLEELEAIAECKATVLRS